MNELSNTDNAFQAYSRLADLKLTVGIYPNFLIGNLLEAIAQDVPRTLIQSKRSLLVGLVSMSGGFNWKNPFRPLGPESRYDMYGREIPQGAIHRKLPNRISGDVFLGNMTGIFNANTGGNLSPVVLTNPIQDKAGFLKWVQLSHQQEFLRKYGFGEIQEYVSKTDELLVDDTPDLIAQRKSRNVTESLSGYAFAYTPGYRLLERTIQKLGGVSRLTNDHLFTAFALNRYYSNPVDRPSGFESQTADSYNSYNRRRKPINYQEVTGLKQTAVCLQGSGNSIISRGFDPNKVLEDEAMTNKFCNDNCPFFRAKTCGVLLHRASAYITNPAERKALASKAEITLQGFKNELIRWYI
jgi:hypothetical protein